MDKYLIFPVMKEYSVYSMTDKNIDPVKEAIEVK